MQVNLYVFHVLRISITYYTYAELQAVSKSHLFLHVSVSFTFANPQFISLWLTQSAYGNTCLPYLAAAYNEHLQLTCCTQLSECLALHYRASSMVHSFVLL